MQYMANRVGHKLGTYEYICNDCGYCSSDSDVVVETSKGRICRCADCGSRNLSEHRVEEGWDYPDDVMDAMAVFSIKCLRLVDLIPYLSDNGWSTVVKRTGELSNPNTYTYPERFRVCKIDYCSNEGLLVVVEEL